MKKLCCVFAASLLLMSCGGNKSKEEVSATPPQEASENLGIWEVDNYIDDFNEKTDEQYMSTRVKGQFSNSATTNSDLGAKIVVDKDGSEIKLYEYNSNHPVVLDKYLMFKVKESNGDIQIIPTYKGALITMMPSSNTDSLFRAILSRGGEIKFTATLEEYGSKSTYNFTIPNADHFQEALNKINTK